MAVFRCANVGKAMEANSARHNSRAKFRRTDTLPERSWAIRMFIGFLLSFSGRLDMEGKC